MSRHGKFRQEDGYVLLCHCKHLQDFRLDSSFLPLLERLAHEGIGAAERVRLTEAEQQLMTDLGKVSLLEEMDSQKLGGVELDRRSASEIWERLPYADEF